MATVTTTADSVTTSDVAPTTAPHKVSHQTGKTTATVRFTPTHSAGASITCYRVEVGGAGPGAGTLVASAGFPCSDSLPESRCSDSATNRRCTDGAGLTSGVQIAVAVADTSLVGADGAYTVKAYAGAADVALG